MREETDLQTGEQWIVLNNDELRMGFMAQCVEKLAEKEHTNYLTLFERLEKVDMTEGFILKHYDTLHTESVENILQTLSDLLHKREKEG